MGHDVRCLGEVVLGGQRGRWRRTLWMRVGLYVRWVRVEMVRVVVMGVMVMGVMVVVVEVWVMCGQRGRHRRQRSLLEAWTSQDSPLSRHETVLSVAPYGPIAISRAVGELRVHGELGLRFVHAQTWRVAVGDLRHILRSRRRVRKLCIQGSIIGGSTILSRVTTGVTGAFLSDVG